MTIEKLRIVAKLTQSKYGNKRYEAGFEILLNLTITITMVYRSKKISIRASNGACAPKKRIDHKKLKNSWTPKESKASLTFLFFNPLIHTRYSDTPIIK